MLLATTLLLAAGFVFFIPTAAYEVSSNQSPSYTTDGTKLSGVSARAWGVFDTESRQLLFGHNEDTAYPIASVTKLMTASVTLDTLLLEATTTLSRQAIATEGKAGGLTAGEEFSVRELLFPLILSSSNDAAEAIAEYEGRETFINAMNATAKKLGMNDTHYADPSGLSASSTSSAADLATLLEYLVREQPYLVDISKLDTYVGEEHSWKNINPASHVETYQGGKHGYTDEASRTMAALFEEDIAPDSTRTFTVVLLGSDNLKIDMETIRTYLRSHLSYQ